MSALRRNSPSGVFAWQTQVRTPTAMKFSLMSLMVASVHSEGSRPQRPAVQQPAAGAPPLPAQRNNGLPSAAAFCLASQTLGYQVTSIQRDSPDCGLIISCSLLNFDAERPASVFSCARTGPER